MGARGIMPKVRTRMSDSLNFLPTRSRQAETFPVSSDIAGVLAFMPSLKLQLNLTVVDKNGGFVCFHVAKLIT